ncbi:protein 4.1-like isoform X2 [Mya arenaria]|uniref:protein 4.1-like isoform X2 n=1 Tax=Mya arenaria TaxID=6604 RepID=UPI0022E92629|nr:protein 4.1-like isoform X2 [Mya arenaria]
MTLFRKSKSKGDLQQEFQTTVRFLDDSEPIQVPFTKETVGQYVLDKVCETLNLVEKDYFGLRYVDTEKQRHWLDPTKTVYKQLKGVSPCVLCFRVKFYPAEPMKLHEEITRYYLFLQLRRDLHHGRLLCSPQDANLLAAYIIQSEVGDYDPEDHQAGYVSEFKMLPNQNVQQEEQIHELHKTIAGQVPAEAEANFLKKAASLDTYGVDPHKVKDQKNNQMYLGVTHQGIMTFHGSRRTQIYKWSQIKKLAFEGKTFIAHVNVNEDADTSHKKKHQPIGYKCLSVAACKYLWRCAVEQQFFFTLQNSFHTPKIRSGGSLFSRGSKFRFSGRCQNEAYMASEDIKRKEPDFQRTCSLPNFSRKSDAKIHMRNSANLSITEDKNTGGFRANTLPHMTSAPSVSVQPNNFEKRRNSRGSRENVRRDSEGRRRSRDQLNERKMSGSHTESETKREEPIAPVRAPLAEVEIMQQSVPVEVYRQEKTDTRPVSKETSIDEVFMPVSVSMPESKPGRTPEQNAVKPGERPAFDPFKVKNQETEFKTHEVPKASEPGNQEQPVTQVAHKDVKPHVREMGHYTTREVRKYVEVEQRQTVIGPETVVIPAHTKAAKLESKVVTRPVDDVSKLAYKENAVDVPIEARTAERPQSSRPVTQETPVMEETMVQQRADRVQAAGPDSMKMNGGIPTISVSSPLDSETRVGEADTTQLYEPNVTVEEDEDDEGVAKSLEEQVMDLEKEIEQTHNHVQPDTPSRETKPTTRPVVQAKGSCSCGKIFAYTFFSLFFTLTVSACVVMFSDIDHPLMNEARSHLAFLEPTRDFIRHKYEEIVNRL